MNPVASQLKQFLAQLTLMRKITLLILIGSSVAGFYYLMNWSGRPDFQVLFSGLSAEDTGSVMEQLRQGKIACELSKDGTAIKVPGEKVYAARMLLASHGLPKGGSVGFELFDNAKIGMTEFAQNVNYQRALQGELSRTIDQLDEVESSRIHIVMAKESVFLDSEAPATASVVVKLRNGAVLKQDQIRGIVHLVSSGVSGLNPKNVTVIDSYGNMLSGFDDETGLGQVALDRLAFQEKVERKLENRIKTMLNAVLGPNKAIVRLSSTINFQQQERTEEKYLPKNQVVRSEQKERKTTSKPSQIPAGIPGKGAYSFAGKGKTDKNKGQLLYEHQDQSTNYEIGKITSHIVEPVGEIMKLSVAVLVDGSYKTVEVKKGETESQYVPRTPEEMTKIENIVKRAMNFDTTRQDEVEVVNIPFQKIDDAIVEPQEAESGLEAKLRPYKEYIKYGLALMIFLLAYFSVVRPVIKWLTSFSVQNAEIIPQLPMTVGEIESGYAGASQGSNYSSKAANLLKSDQNASINLLKEWIEQS